MGHGILAGALVLARGHLSHEPLPQRQLVEMEFMAPAPEEPEPAALQPAEPPEPVIETEPPAVAQQRATQAKPVKARKPANQPRSAPEVAASLDPDSEPAPGTPANDDAMAPERVYRLDSAAPGGSIPVARGVSSGSAHGVAGGTGSNTGGGGDRPGGTGVAGDPAPVSIAAIKRPALPIGDTDFLDDDSYPTAARRDKVEGPVKVKLLVDDRGRVTRANLVTRLGHGLDQRALVLARKLEFRPAIDMSDRPVSSVVVWTFRFRLPS